MYRLSYLLVNTFNVVDNFTLTNSWNVSVGGVDVDNFFGARSTEDYVLRSVLVTIPANVNSTSLVFAFRQVTPCPQSLLPLICGNPVKDFG
jgi:hypothetical protein